MRWNPDYPVSLLPEKIRKKFVERAEFLIENLNYSCLEVILVPAPVQRHEGHKIRVAINKNPEWYREIYHSWCTDHFKRHRAVEALQRITNLEDGRKVNRKKGRKIVNGPYAYDALFRGIILDILTEGLNEYGIKKDKTSTRFFNGKKVSFSNHKEVHEDIPF